MTTGTSPAPVSVGSLAATRPAVDLRSLITSPLIEQGARPLCLPFSLSHAHEAALGGAADAATAPEAIWWHCSRLGQVSAEGMQVEHGGKALARNGQPPLSQWPWNPLLGAGTEDPPPAAGRPPWRTATMSPLELAHDGVEGEVEDELAAGNPVVLVLEVTAEFENPDADGVIATPDIRSPTGDYHAVLVVGATSEITNHPSQHGTTPGAPTAGAGAGNGAAAEDSGQRHLLIRNSWGEYWGVGGYGWLPVDYLIAFAGQAAVVSS